MKKNTQPARSAGQVPRRLLLPVLLLIAGAVTAPLSLAQSAKPGRVLQEATEKAAQIEAITGAGPTRKAPAGDPCALLPAAEVKKAFPDAAVAAPERSRRLEQYGITECAWKSANGQILLGVQESSSESPTHARDEALGMAQGFVDPLKSGALKNVRIETFAMPGIDNAAFVETMNPARGILSNGAFLALVKGRQLVTLMSPGLPDRDRAEALKALQELGTAAAKSMR